LCLDGALILPQSTTADMYDMIARRLLAIGCAVLLVVALPLSGLAREVGSQENAQGAGHGDDATVDWEPIGLTLPVLQLYSPASGALLARTESALFQSDDAGSSWNSLPLPPSTLRVALSPADQTVLYAAADGGVHKTTDSGRDWSLLLPTDEHVLALAVSQADPELLYIGLTGSPRPSIDFRFLRSSDGGNVWTVLEESHNTLCGWDVRLLEPHPTDPERAFRAAGCYAGRNIGDVLQHSVDRGTTWLTFLRPQSAFPTRLVGGQGSVPSRLYVAANRDLRAGGSSLFRSDDDGNGWMEVLSHRGGGTLQEPTAPNITIAGLTYDPVQPDAVWVGLNTRASADSEPTGAVRFSEDGGATWLDIGTGDLGTIHDLALGIDGLNLYLATTRGVWRHGLPGPPQDTPKTAD